MNINLNLIIILLLVGKISASNIGMNQDPYLYSDHLASVEKISISKLLDYKKIAIGIKYILLDPINITANPPNTFRRVWPASIFANNLTDKLIGLIQ